MCVLWGVGGLENRNTGKILLEDTVDFLFSNTSSRSVLSELLQMFYRAGAFEESPYVQTDNGFHLQ